MQNKEQEIDKALLREMFNVIRNSEIKNVKIQKFDDKQMAARIAKYISNKIRE